MESKAPAMVSPSTMPASHRTPGPSGTTSLVTVPGAGMKLRPGILAVDPELDGVRVRLGVVVAELLAVGDAELLTHQVDAGDLLGDGCSTWRRVLTSRKEMSPSWPTRYSQVPAPT
jgi:hypothetical protein